MRSVIPGSPRDLFKKAAISKQPHRHPGLAPGSIRKGRDFKTTSPSSRACPGTYSKRPRFQNNHCLMCQRSRISLRDSGTTTSPSSRACPGTYTKRPRFQNNLTVIPGLSRDLIEKAVISKQPLFDVSKIPDIAARFRDDGWGYRVTFSETTTSPSSRACPGTYSKRP